MKLLLGATVALLLGAIVLSWQGMKQGVENASPEEIAQMKIQIAQMQAELNEASGSNAATNSVPAASDVQQLKSQLATQQAVIDELQAKQNAELEQQLKVDEDGLIAQKMLESKDSELRRARIISQALLMGKVKEYVSDPEFGSFIIFQPTMPEHIQVGSVLGIRRNTGIIAKYKVSEITAEGAIANPLPGFGPFEPSAGDELVYPPPF